MAKANLTPTQQAGLTAKNAQLSGLLSSSNWMGFTVELQRICNVLTIKDDLIEEDFINQIKQNAWNYPTDEVRASGKAYFTDVEKEQIVEEIVDTCGGPVTVKTVMCGKPHKSQKPEDYVDYLELNISKRLSVYLDLDELRALSCNENTYNDLVELIRSKITSATYDLIYCEIMKRLNDPLNYKQSVDIQYCCDKCNGQNKLAALNSFILKLQRNTAPYNIAGRDYNLPTNKMWLLKSYDTDSSFQSMLGNTFNPNYLNVESKFEHTWALDIKIADAIIIDKLGIRFNEIVNQRVVMLDGWQNAECITAQYRGKVKLINHAVAIPVNFVEVKCEDKKAAEALAAKISNVTTEYSVSDQSDAETQIKAEIDALNTSTEPKLTLEYSFDKFKAPNGGNGSIETTVDIKDSNGTKLDSVTKTFVLKKK